MTAAAAQALYRDQGSSRALQEEQALSRLQNPPLSTCSTSSVAGSRPSIKRSLVLGGDVAQVAADGDDAGQRLDLAGVVLVHLGHQLRQSVVHGRSPGAVRLLHCTPAAVVKIGGKEGMDDCSSIAENSPTTPVGSEKNGREEWAENQRKRPEFMKSTEFIECRNPGSGKEMRQ
jgi:hypothetical protein